MLGIVAVALSLAGTAAAAGLLITKSSQIKAGVIQVRHLSKAARKALKGQAGPAGAVGATGATGPQGAKGDGGAPGQPGSAGPLLDTLPSGRTVRGTYSLRTEAASVETAISYQFPLASAPTAEIVHAPATTGTANCPGSISDPKAVAGKLCIYEGVSSGTMPDPMLTVFNPEIGAPGPPLSLYGFGLKIAAGTGANPSHSEGTWAVTAP